MRNIRTRRIFRRGVVAVFAMLLADGASLAHTRDGVPEVPANALIREFFESLDKAEAAPANVRSEEAAPQSSHTPLVATLLNLSPWRSWIHLFCDQTVGACEVDFWCGQQTGDPVAWDVEVPAGRIFAYWPGKTDAAGRSADFETALVEAGLTASEARARTTCTVRSNDPVQARAYTFIAGQILPVANHTPSASPTSPPDDTGTPSLSSGSYTMEWTVISCVGISPGQRISFPFTLTVSGSSFSGSHPGSGTTTGQTWYWNGTISSSGRITGLLRIGNASGPFTGQVDGPRSASGSVPGSCSLDWRIS